MSAEEATWYLNMYPFTGLSRGVIWLDTNSPEKRFRMTTPVIQEEGTILYKVMSNNIEKYRHRPTSIEKYKNLAKKYDGNPLTLSYMEFDRMSLIEFHAWLEPRYHQNNRDYQRKDDPNDILHEPEQEEEIVGKQVVTIDGRRLNYIPVKTLQMAGYTRRTNAKII